MNSTRRDFLAKTGLAGTGLMAASFLRGATPPKAPTASAGRGARSQHFNMCGYAAPKLEKVRVGLVGVGSRGSSAIPRLKVIEGLEIKALCDIDPGQIAGALKKLEGTAHKPATYSDSEDAWKKM
jgi:hypothetical protein